MKNKKETNENNKVKELIINNSTDGEFYITELSRDFIGEWTLKFKIKDVTKPFSLVIRAMP